jgi:prepilin-type N-terminal cleavage/methylation domain-containing protein
MDRLKRQSGFTLVEILIVVAIVLLLLGIAAPKLARARIQGYEGGAIRALRTLHVAQAQYYSETGRHAVTLDELAKRGNIAGDLASGEKSGYRFELKSSKTGYQIYAHPLHSDARRFYTNDSLAIFAGPPGRDSDSFPETVQPASSIERPK